MSRGTAVYAFFVLLFGVLCYFANRYDYFPGDVAISQQVQDISRTWFEPIMRYAPYIVGAALVIVLLSRLWWRRLVCIAIATAGAGFISWLLKLLISRSRPDTELVQIMVGTQGLSFPSGHVAMAAAIGGFIFYLTPRLIETPAARWSLRALLVVIILAVGLSRIYLGAHWASDVVGGLFLGILLLYPAIALYKKYDAKRVKNA